MPLDSDPPAPSTHRNRFFPSPSFTTQSNLRSKTLTRNPKNLTSFPSPSRTPKSYISPSRSQTFASSRSFSSSPSIPRRNARYAGIHRKVDSASQYEKSSKPDVSEVVTGKMTDVRKALKGFKVGRSNVRWNLALSVVLMVTCLSSLLHKNFTLQNQVKGLQDQLLELNTRLQACSLMDPKDIVNIVAQDSVDASNRSLKNSALFVSLAFLAVPLLIFKYFDYVSSLRRSSENNKNSEELSLNKQLAYRVDVFLSVRPYSKPLALLLATLLLICLGGLALYGVTDDNVADCLWLSWTYVADSGNHANSEGFGPKLVSVSISFGGMLIFAMMLGLVSDAISEKFDSLRKGKSEVIEKNHTLILGWSDKLGSLLNQLAIANESLGGGTVVVMAERDKEEMELDIAKMEFDFKGTPVICRSGCPLILADLKKVSVSKARAVIVLAEDGNADQSDARALRTVLGLTGVKEGLRGHIVVELSDLDNEVLVKLVGGDLVETVVAHDVIGRLMIQCARQPGLAQIWEDILGFEKSEFYIKRWPQLDGMRFQDVLISFPDAIPCGIKVASSRGKIILNPDDSYVLQEGDEVLVIAEDDDSYSPTTLPMVWRGFLPKDFIVPKSPERILFCGWRRDMEDMIMVLDAFLAPGSELWMFNDVPEKEREKKLIEGGLDTGRLVNISLVNREGNAVIRRHLESIPLESFDSILILADESVEDSAIQADSRSLATLLLIRDIQGNELHIRLADIYLHEDEELSFYEIILRARQRKEILIGYRLASAERAVINPPSKSERRRWSPKDVFVVIADKE
ncbi:probable ion channel CASTOR isoform X5 [Magnolia sinica]|uniref:probable ion channel CASTOR isoform X5 n=1 Tax=Magnolia sinica TaxID=86752 RepID=UPI00265A5B32|nr:probable ion channel CASTOR isoform X5 [Magnolia sinica]